MLVKVADALAGVDAHTTAGQETGAKPSATIFAKIFFPN
jgi:hypothetical protein